MARIGFHAWREQFPPAELLRLVQLAEAASFDCALSRDHSRPLGRLRASRPLPGPGSARRRSPRLPSGRTRLRATAISGHPGVEGGRAVPPSLVWHPPPRRTCRPCA